jgi:hypothetical protein
VETLWSPSLDEVEVSSVGSVGLEKTKVRVSQSQMLWRRWRLLLSKSVCIKHPGYGRVTQKKKKRE